MELPETFQHRRAVVDEASGREWTYAELMSQSLAQVRALQLASRSFVFLFSKNDLATIVNYVGLRQAGHAIVLLDANISPAQRDSLIETYSPAAVVDVAGSNYSPPGYRSIESPHGMAWANLAGGPPMHRDLSVLLPTSGTTGSPKLVRLSEKNLDSNARSIREYLGISENEVAPTSLPLHYSYGLSVINSHLISGATLIITDASVLEERFWHTFEKYSCTSFAGVPYSYEIMARAGRDKALPVSLHTMTQAGGRLAPHIVKRFGALMQQRKGRFVVMYGQTEATARIAYVPPHRLHEKEGSAGIPVPSGTLSVVDKDGKCLGPGDEGEIVYAGPNVMMGYASTAEELLQGDNHAGVLHTGDLGYLDNEGFLFITGRAKRIAKIFGVRISFDDVESRARKYGPVGVVGDDKGLHIFIEGSDMTSLDEWKRELAEVLSIPHFAFTFHPITSLPLTTSGKIDYSKLKEMSA